MKEKNSTFALSNEGEEPTALATDVGKNIPILDGEVAERFEQMARENEEKALKMRNEPITIEEAKRILPYKKMIYKHELKQLKSLEEEIKTLENIINSAN